MVHRTVGKTIRKHGYKGFAVVDAQEGVHVRATQIEAAEIAVAAILSIKQNYPNVTGAWDAVEAISRIRIDGEAIPWSFANGD